MFSWFVAVPPGSALGPLAYILPPMKPFPTLIVSAFSVSLILFQIVCTSPTPPDRFTQTKRTVPLKLLEVKNPQGVRLGRIEDLGIDLVHGRIVEVLVISGDFMGLGGKVVAVPPHVLARDPDGDFCTLSASTAVFEAAPGIKLSQWKDTGRSDRVAAAYHHFGEEPYFTEDGGGPNRSDGQPKEPLGPMELASRLTGFPVRNLQGELLGKVWSMNLNIPRGRILNVVIAEQNASQTMRIVPAMALSFATGRETLVLDDTKEEFATEPRYVYMEDKIGNDSTAKREPYQGPHTLVALEQGDSEYDLARTALIRQNIRQSKMSGRNVEVGTLYGRVTLRGWVLTAEDKRRIVAIAIAVAREEIVDNQIVVGAPSILN